MISSCLASEATACVVGAPFPEEIGRDTIRDTSLAYLLDHEPHLRAEAVEHPAADILLLDDRNRVEMAIHVKEADGRATSLDYYTVPHRPDEVAEIARDLGREIAAG